MDKYIQTIRRQIANKLSVFHHFVGLSLKRLIQNIANLSPFIFLTEHIMKNPRVTISTSPQDLFQYIWLHQEK